MKEIITIDELNSNSVSVKRERVVEIEGAEYKLPNPTRKAYVNSINGRNELEEELSEPYLAAVLTVWGDNPTVDETLQDEETSN